MKKIIEGRRFSGSMQMTAVVVAVAFIGMCYDKAQHSASIASEVAPLPRVRTPLPPPQPPSHEELLAGSVVQWSRSIETVLSKPGAPTMSSEGVEPLLQQLGRLEHENLEEFAKVERHLVENKLPAELLTRHQEVVRAFQAEVSSLRGVLSAVQGARTPQERVRLAAKARELVASKFQEERHRPVDLKRLPFRAPQQKAPEPVLSADGLRARLSALGTDARASGADATGPVELTAEPSPADLAPTDDVQLTQAIQDLAASLGHEPARIFNWVHDNIRFLPTYGSVQGSQLTLLARQGNAFDTASLLIALLRASNVPARYVYGTVQIPAAQARGWVGGVPTAQAAQELLGMGGIPIAAVVQGGTVTHLRLEHVWVEAFVDFEPSRGAVHKQGDTWVPMDASYKQHERQAGLDLRSETSESFIDILTNVYSGAQTDSTGGITELHPGYVEEKALADGQEALRQLEAKFPNLTNEQLAGTLRIAPRMSSVLDANLPYDLISRGASVSALSAGLRHAVTLRLYATPLDRALDYPDLEARVSLPVLNSRRLSFKYAPASAADAQLIQSYVTAGASSVPVYLVRMIPQVQLDGVTLAQGSVVTMGTKQSWELVLSGPNDPGGYPDVYDITVGSEGVFGIDGNGLTREVVQARYDAVQEVTVAENMHQVALRFFWQHDYFDEFAANMRNVFKQRLPSAGLFSYPLEVRYLFGLPRWGSYNGRTMDVKRVMLAVSAESNQARFDYMSQAGMQGSYLEGAVLDQVFGRMQGTSSSSAQVLIDAAEAEIPIYSINQTNVATVLPMVSVSEDVRQEITAAIAAGKTVLVPRSDPRGVTGYVIQDPETGAAAYLIEGGLSGGVGEACERQPQGQPVQVPQLSTFDKLMLVLMILAILGLMFTPGGQGPGLAVARVVVAIVFAAILAPSNAYAAQPQVCCIPKQVPHLGGNLVHDRCADLVPPNVYPGYDVKVDGKNFDALSDDKTLWEAKTDNFDNCRTPFCQYVLLPMRMASYRRQLAKYQESAHYCNYSFALAAGDPRLVAAMDGLYDRVELSELCLQPLK